MNVVLVVVTVIGPRLRLAYSLQLLGLKPLPMERGRPVFSVFILQIARVHFPTVTQASQAEFGSASAINIRSHRVHTREPIFYSQPLTAATLFGI
jgi:hypothetical protein